MKWQNEHKKPLSDKSSKPSNVEASVKRYIARTEPSDKSNLRLELACLDRRRNDCIRRENERPAMPKIIF